jgi:hypothetical protein
MNTSSAGRRPAHYPISSNSTSFSFLASKDKPKCPTPKYTSFNLDSVLTPFASAGAPKPFKFLSFDNSTMTPKHRRQPSVIIKNVSQVYNFGFDPVSSSEVVSEEDCVSITAHQQKNSIFASTTDRKSSFYSSTVKKRVSEEDTSRLEVSEYCENSEGVTKPDENFTTLGVSTYEGGRESPFGILPKKMHCSKCGLETTTLVSIKMPTVPFWKVMCCLGSISDACCDVESLEKFQEFQHRCRHCKSLLVSAQPR